MEEKLERAVALCVGGYHILLSDEQGSIWGAGDNSRGQLGQLPLAKVGVYNEGANIKTLKKIQNLPPIISIHAARFRSFFIDFDGSVWACGENESGQLGAGEVEMSMPHKISGICNIENIFSSTYWTFFQDRAGQLWGCGVTDNFEESRVEPSQKHVIQMNTQLPGLKAIVLNKYHCLYVDAAGDVWENKPRQLNAAFFDGWEKAIEFPNVQAVSSGANHTMFLDQSSRVWGLGDNNFRQCGLGRKNEVENAIRKPMILENIPEIKEIQTGTSFSLLLDVDGCVWAFGYNGQGQLGIEGENFNVNRKFRPKKLANLPVIAKIYCGHYFSMLLDENGELWGSGSLRFQTHKPVTFERLQGLPEVVLYRNLRIKSARN